MAKVSGQMRSTLSLASSVSVSKVASPTLETPCYSSRRLKEAHRRDAFVFMKERERETGKRKETSSVRSRVPKVVSSRVSRLLT